MKTKNEKLDIINMIDDVFILEHGVLWSYTVHYGKLMKYILFYSRCVVFVFCCRFNVVRNQYNQLCKSFIAFKSKTELMRWRFGANSATVSTQKYIILRNIEDICCKFFHSVQAICFRFRWPNILLPTANSDYNV